MITNRSDTYDWSAYHMLPIKDRWIMNKLQLAERLGYRCGPHGTPLPVAGDYCIRPVYSIAGGGGSGVYKHNSAAPGVNNTPAAPGGYFWCEWFDGPNIGVDYRDDIPIQAFGADPDENGDFQSYEARPERTELPDMLKGIAKYLMVEFIGDKIVEVSLRWQWRVQYMIKVYAPDGSFTWDYGDHYAQQDDSQDKETL